ncbi:hypothetical protein LJC71_06840 [Desulfosarcina sp. OttesenSCG-928-A07]|nr:hypothetical protein [Desulfosarcina sp. OttesenSCG-928-G17]MDL2329441.1 hypothetical protein [Desulfosarcina sp. OttesenSCG-928-A07]
MICIKTATNTLKVAAGNLAEAVVHRIRKEHTVVHHAEDWVFERGKQLTAVNDADGLLSMLPESGGLFQVKSGIRENAWGAKNRRTGKKDRAEQKTLDRVTLIGVTI